MTKDRIVSYSVKYRKNLIEKVLSTKFKSIKDLSNFINLQEKSKVKECGLDFTFYSEKIISKVFDNLYLFLKSSFPETFNFKSSKDLCLFFISEFKQCLKDFTTFTKSENYCFTEHDIKFKVIKSNTSDSISLSRYEILCLHAFSFFHIEWNNYQGEHFCDTSFIQLYNTDKYPEGLQKLLCYFNYYYFMFTHKEFYDDKVSLEQKNIKEKFDFNHANIPLKRYKYVQDGIETCQGENHVDFANARLIYSIWPSVTQEELLLCVRPELVVLPMFIEKMSEEDIIFMRNSLHINKSIGYGETFAFDGIYEDINFIKRNNTIIAMDSYPRNSYKEEVILRDLHKCFMGFKFATKETNGIICTGRWGCGAFRNDPVLKLLEMFIVGSALDIKEEEIHFHWLGQEDFDETFIVVDKCIKKGLTIEKILEIVLSYKDTTQKFENFMIKKVDEI